MSQSQMSQSQTEVRASRRLAEWRENLSAAFRPILRQARNPQEQAEVFEVYTATLEKGPDFLRHRGKADFRTPPRIRLDRNMLARICLQLKILARIGWDAKEKGKQGGFVRRTTILVLEALCGLARKHGQAFPSLENLAKLATCSKTTVVDALTRLSLLGFVSVHRRLKRERVASGYRVMQDTNAYDLHEPARLAGRPLSAGRSEFNRRRAIEIESIYLERPRPSPRNLEGLPLSPRPLSAFAS